MQAVDKKERSLNHGNKAIGSASTKWALGSSGQHVRLLRQTSHITGYKIGSGPRGMQGAKLLLLCRRSAVHNRTVIHSPGLRVPGCLTLASRQRAWL